MKVFVAQLVEQLTLNQWVQGSSPCEDTENEINFSQKACKHAVLWAFVLLINPLYINLNSNMKENFDYKDVPAGYDHCLNAPCLRSAECLRFKIGTLVNKDVAYFSIINPLYVAEHATCPYFQANRLTRYAYGITHLYDNLSYTQYPEIKRQIYAHFGHSYYYRIRNKVLPIKPEDQDFIRELFRKEGIDTEPLFDEYVEMYNFFPNNK